MSGYKNVWERRPRSSDFHCKNVINTLTAQHHLQMEEGDYFLLAVSSQHTRLQSLYKPKFEDTIQDGKQPFFELKLLQSQDSLVP